MKINTYAGAGLLLITFIVVVAAVVLSLGCADDGGTGVNESVDAGTLNDGMELSGQWDGSTVNASTGDNFSIRLEENPSTGYQWNLTTSDGIKIVADEFELPENEGVVGEAGFHVWTFRIMDDGNQQIDAIYKRPWENVTGEEETFSLTLEVEGESVVPADEDDTGYIYGTADVDNIEIMKMESFPVQVSVRATGNLKDGCTVIDEANITTAKKGNNFNVHIPTKRPKDAMCTQALVPFEINVPLDVYGLEKGNYTVDVNGVQGSFPLQNDNVLE
ncbi:protease inhibitor I42 family protein [Methanohalophilus halophilus]|uniref:protease inhibitor I42 family protein n=1 Tax=Methanohalophilus halophilus TaxID=2177 RepID=UPI0013565EE5|nr:protease inhibitor I42 family protein [Methanohalophilus halophilus]